ncbi:MAG: TonB-dependent receptor [Bacteroidota bacterium]
MNKHLLFTLSFLLTTLFTQAQEGVISGKVTDTDGNAIIGANIYILDSREGTSSGEDGTYRLERLKRQNYFIRVSYLGFETQTRKVVVGQNDSEDFQLSPTSDQLNEVVITANRRLQDIQKTATSVSAIGVKQVEQLQVKQFAELNSIAPNFRSYDDGGTGSFTLIASRGISTVDFVPTIGLYVDDVPYFTTFAFPLSLSDVEQIEILRGPQGTLYGRNALAGVIKITTKRPSQALSGFATVGFGNLNSKEIGFGINTPVVKDKLYFRANANITERDGFVRNIFNGKDLQDREAFDANFKMKYYANDRLSLSLLYNLQRRESAAYAFSLATPPNNTFQDILANSLYQVNFNEDVFRNVLTQNIALNLKYDFDAFSLNAITSYQKTDQSRLDEFDYTPFDIQSAQSTFDLQNLTQELRLASLGESKFNWTTGVFLYLTDRENLDQLRVGNDAGILDPNLVPLVPYNQIDRPNVEQKGVAVFGQASYDLTKELTLTAGIRYDHEEVDAAVNRVFTSPAFPEGSFAESATFDAFSPKVALGYQAADDVFLFANVARGFRPGGVNTFVSDVENAPFDPESTWNYEVGLKTNLIENRLKFNLTAFLINYSDQQIFTILDLEAFDFGTDNIGESRSYGLELESQWAATRGLNFTLNLGYLNTEITDYITINPATGLPVDFEGNDLPNSPEFSGNLNVNYIQPLSKKINLETSLDYNYQSDMFFDFGQFPTEGAPTPENQLLQEAYGLLNGRIGLTSKNLDFFIWGKNITDEEYFSYGYGIGGFNAASFALPQTYGATLTAKF